MLTLLIGFAILGVIFMLVFFVALCADGKPRTRCMIVSLTQKPVVSATGGPLEPAVGLSVVDKLMFHPRAGIGKDELPRTTKTWSTRPELTRFRATR